MTHKILLVDDSRTMREVLKVYLMGGAYDFVEADNAARALDLLRLIPVDVVIADVNMPKMDGFEFVRNVRASELPNVRHMPIILLTGDKTQGLRGKSVAAQADAFLLKPVESDRLVEIVTQLLSEKRA